jgi:hypothetical protein
MSLHILTQNKESIEFAKLLSRDAFPKEDVHSEQTKKSSFGLEGAVLKPPNRNESQYPANG